MSKKRVKEFREDEIVLTPGESSDYVIIKDGVVIRHGKCWGCKEAELKLKPDRAAGELLFTEVPKI